MNFEPIVMFEDCSAALIGSNESTWLGRCIAQGESVEVQLMEEGHGQGGIEMLGWDDSISHKYSKMGLAGAG